MRLPILTPMALEKLAERARANVRRRTGVSMSPIPAEVEAAIKACTEQLRRAWISS